MAESLYKPLDKYVWYRVARLAFGHGKDGDVDLTESIKLPDYRVTTKIVKEEFWQTEDCYGVELLIRYEVRK